MKKAIIIAFCGSFFIYPLIALSQDTEFTIEPGDAVIDVTSQPPGAYLSINGASIGNTPVLGIPLRPGTYLVTTEYPGYAKGEMRITLAKDEVRNVYFRLSAGKDSSGWWSTRDFWVGVGIGGFVFLVLVFVPWR